MQLLAFTVVAMVAFLIAYAFDLGGSVSALIFLTILFIGALLRAWAPLLDWIRGPAANRD